MLRGISQPTGDKYRTVTSDHRQSRLSETGIFDKAHGNDYVANQRSDGRDANDLFPPLSRSAELTRRVQDPQRYSAEDQPLRSRSSPGIGFSPNRGQSFSELYGVSDRQSDLSDRRQGSPRRRHDSADRRRDSPSRRRDSPSRRRDSPSRRGSTDRRRSSAERRRGSPDRRDRKKSVERWRVSPDRKRGFGGRVSSTERSMLSPSRRTPDRRRRSKDRRRSSTERVLRRGRTPEKSQRHLDRRARSPTRRSPPLKRGHPANENDYLPPAKQTHNENQTITKLKRRLSPLILDAGSREALTKKIELTWQKYYHKYYSCVATNPEIVLEMQKEYLRSYKGFFKTDPHFEFYYVKVAKPEDLREALTLRIDRGSPGPNPDEMEVNVPVNPYQKQPLTHGRPISWSPDRFHGSRQHSRSPQPKFSSRQSPSKSTLGNTDPGSHQKDNQRAGTTRTNYGVLSSPKSLVDDFPGKSKTAGMNKRSLPPPTGSQQASKLWTVSPLPPPEKAMLPSPTSKNVKSEHTESENSPAPANGRLFSDSNKGISGKAVKEGNANQPSEKGFKSNTDGIFPEASHFSTTVTQAKPREDRFKDREEQQCAQLSIEGGDRQKGETIPRNVTRKTDAGQKAAYTQNDPIITSTTQGFPAERRFQIDRDTKSQRDSDVKSHEIDKKVHVKMDIKTGRDMDMKSRDNTIKTQGDSEMKSRGSRDMNTREDKDVKSRTDVDVKSRSVLGRLGPQRKSGSSPHRESRRSTDYRRRDTYTGRQSRRSSSRDRQQRSKQSDRGTSRSSTSISDRLGPSTSKSKSSDGDLTEVWHKYQMLVTTASFDHFPEFC